MRFDVAGKAATAATTWLVYNNPRTSNNVVDDVTLEVCTKITTEEHTLDLNLNYHHMHMVTDKQS